MPKEQVLYEKIFRMVSISELVLISHIMPIKLSSNFWLLC